MTPLPSDAIRPGMEIGTADGERGTLGLLVRRADSPGQVYGLSCSHVIAESGRAAVDSIVEHPVDRFALPSSLEAGRLTEFCSRLAAKGGGENTDDFALFQLTKPSSPAHVVSGEVATAVSHRRANEILKGTRTWMAGAATVNGSFGVVTSFTQKRLLVQPLPAVGAATFVDVVRYETVCRPGDSGAAVLEEGSNVVLGLHFASDPVHGVGYFLPLGEFFERHGLSLVTA